MGFPPLAGPKKIVFRFQFVRRIVIPAASTGSDTSSKTLVIRTDQMNRGVWY